MIDPVVVDFTVSPLSSPVSFTVGGDPYPYTRQADNVSRASDYRYAAYTVHFNTLLTFTANIAMPANLSVVSWRWNFGDGIVSNGPTVTHTYKTNPPQTQVSLLIIDNKGKRHYRSKLINLR